MKLGFLLLFLCVAAKYNAGGLANIMSTAASSKSVQGELLVEFSEKTEATNKRCLRCKKGKRMAKNPNAKEKGSISTVQINLRGPPVPYAIDLNYFSNYKLVCSKLRANSNVYDAPCYSSQQYLNQLDGFILAITFILAVISAAISRDSSVHVVSAKHIKKLKSKRKIIHMTAEQSGFMIAMDEFDMRSLACPSE